MTEPTDRDSLLDDLAAALRAQADGLPRTRSLGEAAVAGAQRVRVRRAVGTTLAGVLAVVAVAATALHGQNGAATVVVPATQTPTGSAYAPTPAASDAPTGGVTVTATRPPVTPTYTSTADPSSPPRLNVAAVKRGADPTTPYVRRSGSAFEIVDGPVTVPLKWDAQPNAGFRVPGGWVVSGYKDSGSEVLRVATDGSVTKLAHGNVTGVVKAPDGTALIAAVSGAGTLLMHDGTTDQLFGHLKPVGFLDDDRLVLTPATYDEADAGPATIWSLRSKAVAATLPARLRPTTAARGLIGGEDLTRITTAPGDANCGSVVAADAPDVDLWRSCDFVPHLIGADFALLLPAYYDGAGPGQFALLDTATWGLRKNWLVAGRGSMVAEDSSHVLVLAEEDPIKGTGRYTILRCALGTPCDRASEFMSSKDDVWEIALLDP